MPETYYSQDTLEMLWRDVHTFLSLHGPATSGEIQKGINLSQRQLKYLFRVPVYWLVAVGTKPPERKFQTRQTLFDCVGEHVLGWCRLCGEKNFQLAYVDKPRCKRCQTKINAARRLAKKQKPTSNVDPFTPRFGLSQAKRIELYAARVERELPIFLEDQE